jgi:tRNA-splicing ligase RtcB
MEGKNAMTEQTYNVILPEKGVPIKAWTRGVPLEDAAEKQLRNVAALLLFFISPSTMSS